MAWLDLLTAVIVGIPATVVGAVVGWYLAQKSHWRELNQDRVAASRDTRLLLLAELSETRRRLRREVPKSILDAPGLDRFSTFSTSAYEELASAGRLVQLGASRAEPIHRIYRTVSSINELLQEINGEMEPMRATEIEGTFGYQWERVIGCKKDFLKQLKLVEPVLKAGD